MPSSHPFWTSCVERCEKRLVLSAQLLFDLPPDMLGAPDLYELENSPSSWCESTAAASNEGSLTSELVNHQMLTNIENRQVEPKINHAHQNSGWHQVQNQFGLNGSKQTVAVIDSGIAWDHVAFGQGFGGTSRVVGGWDFAENDNLPYDDAPSGFHGSHVAGIIAGNDPTHDFYGVANGADIAALRVFDDGGNGQLSWVEQALQWVQANHDSFENPITTVNLSLGTNWNSSNVPSWATLEDEFAALADQGILVVASAGNSFQSFQEAGLSYPAASPYVLPVASLDAENNLSDFSQRSDNVLAAPGENILSAVPDFVVGSDGIVNDYSFASGTSMAAPYVAGASMLVREAMQMAGLEADAETIQTHLKATANSIFDPITQSSYLSLNLDAAIDALIPEDQNDASLPTPLNVQQSTAPISGWLNDLDDVDAYSFTLASAGTLDVDFSSEWATDLSWEISTVGGESVQLGSLGTASLDLQGGVEYVLSIATNDEIGSYEFSTEFTATAQPHIDWSSVDFRSEALTAGSTVIAQAAQDGLFSVEWIGVGQAENLMTVNGSSISGTALDDQPGLFSFRYDTTALSNQNFEINLPEGFEEGLLTVSNQVQVTGGQVSVTGSNVADNVTADLSSGLLLNVNGMQYEFSNADVTDLHISGQAANDRLELTGSTQSEKVELRPGSAEFSNSSINVRAQGIEEIAFHGGGGHDRVYMYDSDGDDVLTAYPTEVVLTGAGYQFEVSNVNRMFMHSTAGGNDYAYLHDSSGDDTLSMRPQFSSMRGDDFFNYVRGFERVYAYATAGGDDSGLLYDSQADDRFFTSGESASMVGPGFSSFTRGFESVTAYSQMGGQDQALLYGQDQSHHFRQGSDFVGLDGDNLEREARNFSEVSAFASGEQLSEYSRVAVASLAQPEFGHEPAQLAQNELGIPSTNHQPIASNAGHNLQAWIQLEDDRERRDHSETIDLLLQAIDSAS